MAIGGTVAALGGGSQAAVGDEPGAVGLAAAGADMFEQGLADMAKGMALELAAEGFMAIQSGNFSEFGKTAAVDIASAVVSKAAVALAEHTLEPLEGGLEEGVHAALSRDTTSCH